MDCMSSFSLPCLFLSYSNFVFACRHQCQVCTKVSGYVEQRQQLENLSSRLWNPQNLILDTDDAKCKRKLMKLSKSTRENLD